MHVLSHISLFILLVVSGFISEAQNYYANGTARAIGGSCYQLTSAVNWELGSVWYKDKLDLSQNFDLEFECNFGSKDVGADGIVFVLQTNGNKAIGVAGGGIGFEGFSPSVGIEFDDWNNGNYGDIPSDHIAILKNGSVDHTSSNVIAPPVPALSNSGNIEDGQNHLVRITWNATTYLLEVWFDCAKRQSVKLDLVKDIFDGESQVFWGFTASTGGENNVQTVCLKDNILTPDTFYICGEDGVELNVRESEDNKYTWTPNQYLSDNTIQNPMCTATEPITFLVEFTDKCGRNLVDTVIVLPEVIPDLGDLDDVSVCIDEPLSISIANRYGTLFWNGELGGTSFDSLNYQGPLTIKSVNSCGADSTEIVVSLEDCNCKMWFPNIFTPENDGINDTYGAVDPCKRMKDYSLSIYNRWGERVYVTTDVYEFWDGRYNANKKAVEGVYFYIASWTETHGQLETTKIANGAIQVIR